MIVCTKVCTLYFNNSKKLKKGDGMTRELYMAIEFGGQHEAISIIENGADNSYTNHMGMTPLHRACGKNYAEVVKLLIQKCENLDIQDKYKDTPLHKAARDGSVDAVRLLIDANACVDKEDYMKNIPLHNACQNGHEEIAKLLIQHYSDINYQNKFGDTPLHRACYSDNIRIIEILIQHGCNINIQNSYFNTPLDRACVLKRIDIAKILIQYGADVTDSRLDEYSWIQALRTYQNNPEYADNSDEYWLAMVNKSIREENIQSSLMGKNKLYDQVAESVQVKKIFKNTTQESQKIYGISENEAINYINNPFVSVDIKNKLLMNAISWYKSLDGNCVFDSDLLDDIKDPYGVLSNNLDIIKLRDNVTDNVFQKMVKGYEYSTYVYSIMVDAMAKNLLMAEITQDPENIDFKEHFANVYSESIRKFTKYAENFAKNKSPEGLYEIQNTCYKLDDNHQIFNATKKFYPALKEHFVNDFYVSPQCTLFEVDN